jgi:hypothetical protein
MGVAGTETGLSATIKPGLGIKRNQNRHRRSKSNRFHSIANSCVGALASFCALMASVRTSTVYALCENKNWT